MGSERSERSINVEQVGMWRSSASEGGSIDDGKSLQLEKFWSWPK